MIENPSRNLPVLPMQKVIVNVDVQMQRFGAFESSEIIMFDADADEQDKMPQVVEPMTLVDEVLAQPACQLFCR